MTRIKSDTLLPDTEARILQAAEHEFLTKGYAGARTTSIAEAAGVTHAMFHYYFRTKDKLFERIMGEKIALLKEAVFKSVEDMSLSLGDIIRNIIVRHLDFVAAESRSAPVSCRRDIRQSRQVGSVSGAAPYLCSADDGMASGED